MNIFIALLLRPDVDTPKKTLYYNKYRYKVRFDSR